MTQITLQAVPGTFAVTKLGMTSPTPEWATRGIFTSITRTPDELSIVCPEEYVPADVPSERGWRCLRVAGRLDFSMVGTLAALLNPLAQAKITVFVLSTFDTDYLFVRGEDFAVSLQALGRTGHRFAVSD
jgi:hypothetical protein